MASALCTFTGDLTLGRSDISGLSSGDIRYALRWFRRKTRSMGRLAAAREIARPCPRGAQIAQATPIAWALLHILLT
jgi:hypothetical protein